MRASVLHLPGRLLDMVLPPRCPACGEIVESAGRFCAACWRGLAFIGPPWCAHCQVPFEHDRGENAICGACLREPPSHAGVRAAVRYGDVARSLALGLKYRGRRGHAKIAAQLMRRHLPEDVDLLVPVPLHRGRMWTRGYNQAGWIAAALSRASGRPMDMRVIERHRATPSLRGHDAQGRRRAVAGAFSVPAEARERVAGRQLALIDDVYTTGATANACTRALLGAGARTVTILAFARVLDPAQAD